MDFWYDAIRVPFRLALDSLWYGEGRASSFLDKSMSWIDPANAALYALDSTLYPTSNNSWHNEMTIPMWLAGAYGSTNTGKQASFLAQLSTTVYATPGQDYFGNWSGASSYYFNQSLAWMGTAVMNGAAVNVYNDLSVPSQVSKVSGMYFVASQNNVQIVVTDNDGWNNISSITINISDKNNKSITFRYTYDMGTRSFYPLDASLLAQSNLSYYGGKETLTLNLSLLFALTQDFLPGTLNITTNILDFQKNSASLGTQIVYYNRTPSANFQLSSASGYYPTINSIQDTLFVHYTYVNDDDALDTFTWDFGTGAQTPTSNTRNFSYVYPSNLTGSVVVTLTVKDFFNAQIVSTLNLWINKIPVAVLGKSRVTANLYQTVTFDASSSYDDMPLSLNRFDVDVAHGAIYLQSSAQVTYNYNTPGTKDIMLWVIDKYYAQSSTVMTSVYINYNPVPSFVFDPLTANINQTISMDSKSSWDDAHTTISVYEWYAPDINTTHFGATTSFSFPTSGYHTVVLKVTDNWGAVGIVTKSIYVNYKPTASISAQSKFGILPTINSYQDPLTINITSFWDDDNLPHKFYWDFGFGATITNNSATGMTFTFPLGVTGQRVVSLTVQDAYLASNTYTLTFWLNPLPSANFVTSSVTANLGTILNINASASTDDMSISTYIFTVDGQRIVTSSPSIDYQFNNAGTINISLYVSDNYAGYSPLIYKSIYINYDPLPYFNFSPLTANLREVITLDASVSWDDDHTHILGYEWYSPDLQSTHVGIITTFSFTTVDYHPIVLRVTDSWGVAVSITRSLYVNYPPTASFTFNTANVYIPCNITFNANPSGDYDDRIVTYYWNFGDGTVLSTNQSSIVHHYSIPDTKNVSLLVEDFYGATHSVAIDIKLYSTIRINDKYYDTIAHAIDAAVSGDAILINTSRYHAKDYPENLIITKSIKIINESPTYSNAKINGSANGQNCLYISGNIYVEMLGIEPFNALSDKGGAIYLNKATYLLQNSVVCDSTANYGGGIYLENAQLNIVNSTFNNNFVINDGGAIFAYNSTIQASALNFFNNQTVSGNGGALCVDASHLNMANSTLSANQSQSMAGAMFANNSHVTIYKTQLLRNSALNSQAGAVNVVGGTITVSYLLLDGNNTNSMGGAFVLTNTIATFRNNLFVNNQSVDHGGAIYVDKTSFSQLNDTMMDNYSSALGKSLYAINQATLNIKNTLAYTNSGKDIYANSNINFISMNNSLAYSFYAPQGKFNTTNLVVSVNPLVDADYALSVHSPFIDFGDSSLVGGVITTDYNGTSRIKNNAVDIGCFETTDTVPPNVPQYIGLVNQVTINTRITINGICSTDVFSLIFTGVNTSNIRYTLYKTTFTILVTLNELSRNNIVLNVADRAGNISSALSLTITQDALPIPSLVVTYSTSNYTLITTFDASASLPGAATSDLGATINLFTLVFESGEVTYNRTGVFRYVLADLYNQWVSLTLSDNYGLQNTLTLNLTPPTFYITSTLNLMSFPMTFSGNVASVIQTTNAKIWYYDVSTSTTYNRMNLNTNFEVGKGYWVYVPNGAQLATITRSYISDSQVVTLSIKQGWNLIGTPYSKNLSFSKVSFQDGSTLYSQAQAYSNGLIFNTQLWGYDSSATASVYYPYVLANILKVWKGYWIYAAKDLNVICNASANYTAFSTPTFVKKDFFSIDVAAEGYNSKLVLGQSNKVNEWFDPRVDTLAPPTYPNQKVRVYIDNSNLGLLESYNPDISKPWKIVVNNPVGLTVNIKINQLDDKDYALTDENNQPLNSKDLSVADSKTFYVRVVGATSSDQVSNIVVYPNPVNVYKGEQVTFKYDLGSSPANVSLRIYNLAGQKIFRADYSSLDAQGQVGVDNRTLIWNGKDENGQMMGSGMYYYVLMVADKLAKSGKLIVWN